MKPRENVKGEIIRHEAPNKHHNFVGCDLRLYLRVQAIKRQEAQRESGRHAAKGQRWETTAAVTRTQQRSTS